MAELITKAKEILIGVWGESDTTYPTQGDALDYVIADTLSVNQDDAEEQTFEFETSDTPETFYTAGAYKIDLNNAELSDAFVENVMGWLKIKIGSTGSEKQGFVAPETYANRYISLQVKFSDTCYFFIPKISIAPKLVLESVKTNLVYGTLSGTATNCEVEGKIGTASATTKVRTAIGLFRSAIMTKKPA